MPENYSERLRKQADTFSKLKSGLQREEEQLGKQAEVMAEVCQCLHEVCLMLAQYVEGKQQPEKIDVREVH